jgi:hypothetical protein
MAASSADDRVHELATYGQMVLLLHGGSPVQAAKGRRVTSLMEVNQRLLHGLNCDGPGISLGQSLLHLLWD